MVEPSEQLQLRPVADNSQPTRLLIDGYAAEIAARHAQLAADLSLYRAKVADLTQLDPLDFTGLGNLYRSHIEHIEALLDEFVGDGPA